MNGVEAGLEDVASGAGTTATVRDSRPGTTIPGTAVDSTSVVDGSELGWTMLGDGSILPTVAGRRA